VNELNWFWIGVGVAVPPVIGLIVAIPFWRGAQFVFGNLAGTGVFFASAVALILRERAELDRLMLACLDAGFVCLPSPTAFTRFAIYAFIALVETCALFYVSLIVEERRRRRGYAPQWR